MVILTMLRLYKGAINWRRGRERWTLIPHLEDFDFLIIFVWCNLANGEEEKKINLT